VVAPASVGAAPAVIDPPADVVGRRLESHRLAAATALVQETFPERTADCGYNAVVDPAELEPESFLRAPRPTSWRSTAS
jgi:hypothetical protein